MATKTAINRSCDNFRLSQTALVVAGYPLAEDPKTRPPIRSVVWEIVDSELNVVGEPIRRAANLALVARGSYCYFFPEAGPQLLTTFSKERSKGRSKPVRFWAQQQVQLRQVGTSWELVVQIGEREPSTGVRAAAFGQRRPGRGVKRDYGSREKLDRGAKPPLKRPRFNARLSNTLKRGASLGVVSPPANAPGLHQVLSQDDRAVDDAGRPRTCTMLGARGQAQQVPLGRNTAQLPDSPCRRPGTADRPAEVLQLSELVCASGSWAKAALVAVDLGRLTRQEEEALDSYGRRNCIYLITITTRSGREVAVYVGKCQSSGRLRDYTRRSFAGFLGPGEVEPHKQAAWWWAAEQDCTFSMRVVASDSWTPASLKQAETRALSQANFAWNSSSNSGYRMGADFWRSIGLQPAEVKVKQMLTTMFKQPDGGNQKRVLSTNAHNRHTKIRWPLTRPLTAAATTSGSRKDANCAGGSGLPSCRGPEDPTPDPVCSVGDSWGCCSTCRSAAGAGGTGWRVSQEVCYR